ncbi:NUDIX hydrolase [Micromonospora pattaloongensis]|uniref:NUDIX hydrolase n=1 Tax=Micromonospora pattaloongensis TaxID=405436 RepID=UPI001FDF2EE6|nr:NUDIX hydrolase [Micromonospora pattaloongensis]
MLEKLHADVVAVLSAWQPPTATATAARERTLRLLDAGPVALTRDHQPGHVTASTLVVDADGARVLLCLHGKFHRWVQLGGHCEPGDPTLADAALREATEESGITGLQLHPVPIDLDIHPVGCGGGSLHYDVRFAAVAPAGAIERVSAESAALGWFAPDALPEPLADATAQLVAPALAAVTRRSLRPAP